MLAQEQQQYHATDLPAGSEQHQIRAVFTPVPECTPLPVCNGHGFFVNWKECCAVATPGAALLDVAANTGEAAVWLGGDTPLEVPSGEIPSGEHARMAARQAVFGDNGDTATVVKVGVEDAAAATGPPTVARRLSMRCGCCWFFHTNCPVLMEAMAAAAAIAAATVGDPQLVRRTAPRGLQ